jgi:mRNA interferase HicA
MTYREASRKLNTLGCQELPRRGGVSHRKWLNPANQQIAVLPDWGGKDLKIGTHRAAIKQLVIAWEDFEKA